MPRASQAQAAGQSGLRVRVDSSSIEQPIAVSGTSATYSELDRALYDALVEATASAAPNSAESRRHLELYVEILEVSARRRDGQLLLALKTRATLYDTDGNVALAQTHAHASDASSGDVFHGAERMRVTIDTVAGSLAGWLRGLDLQRNPIER